MDVTVVSPITIGGFRTSTRGSLAAVEKPHRLKCQSPDR
jgi:hypothetical protein